jgi:hypothetical protein
MLAASSAARYGRTAAVVEAGAVSDGHSTRANGAGAFAPLDEHDAQLLELVVQQLPVAPPSIICVLHGRRTCVGLPPAQEPARSRSAERDGKPVANQRAVGAASLDDTPGSGHAGPVSRHLSARSEATVESGPGSAGPPLSPRR